MMLRAPMVTRDSGQRQEKLWVQVGRDPKNCLKRWASHRSLLGQIRGLGWVGVFLGCTLIAVLQNQRSTPHMVGIFVAQNTSL